MGDAPPSPPAIAHRTRGFGVKILVLCGSLRAQSSNRALLQAYERLAPSSISVQHYEQLGELPHCNPDLDGETVPHQAGALRSLVASADAVIISTPEYAHGLPGAFKNALDWLVSDPAFAGKPVVILHSSRGSAWALDSLKEVLRTKSARIIETASVSLPLGSNQLDAEAILTRADLRQLLRHSIEELENDAKMKP